MLLMYLLIGFIILLILFLFSSIKIKVRLLKDNTCEELIFHIYLFYGLIKYRMEIPFVEILNKTQAITSTEINSDIEISNHETIKDQKREDFSWDELESIYNQVTLLYRKYKIGIHYINERVVMDEISWYTEVGVGDAAATAITTGFFWAIKSNIIALLIKKLDLKSYHVNVYPFYGSDKFNTSLDCIITLKIGYIIIAGYKILTKKKLNR